MHDMSGQKNQGLSPLSSSFHRSDHLDTVRRDETQLHALYSWTERCTIFSALDLIRDNVILLIPPPSPVYLARRRPGAKEIHTQERAGR